MNRRGFLSTLVGGVAVSAAARTWPYRVFSFPEQIQVFDFTLLRQTLATLRVNGFIREAIIESKVIKLPLRGVQYEFSDSGKERIVSYCDIKPRSLGGTNSFYTGAIGFDPVPSKDLDIWRKRFEASS